MTSGAGSELWVAFPFGTYACCLHVLQVLQECFEKKDIQMLQDAVAKLPKEEAEYHIKRCVDSGLWVPNAKDAEKEKDREGGAEDKDDGSDNEVYHELD